MTIEKLFGFIGILAFGLLYALYRSWAYRDKDDKGPEMTGPATVKAHRVVQGRYTGKAPSRWNYMVTFTLAGGEELELYTGQGDFQALKDSISGQLTWQGKRFYGFEPEQ